MSCSRLDFLITEARGRDQCHSTTKWFETLIDPKMLWNMDFGTSTKNYFRRYAQTLRQCDYYNMPPFGTMPAKFVVEDRSSTLLT